MRIIYVANHNQNDSNDDEGAICHALYQLGHHVMPIHESCGEYYRHLGKADLVLFHKWFDPYTLQRINCPKVFWHFDLVDFNDPILSRRCEQRKYWMNTIIPLVDLGFCTDGDWVNQDKTGKLVRLTQGFDDRLHPAVKPNGLWVDLVFTGISRGGGSGRESWVRQLKDRYGHRFCHVEKGLHGFGLAKVISTAKIVLAPDSPVTDYYWSNRVYNMLGLGAFLMHPKCETLRSQYTPGEHYVEYSSREELFSKIDLYLGDELCSDRARIGAQARQKTLGYHTYRHRCEVLIRTVQERLNLWQS